MRRSSRFGPRSYRIGSLPLLALLTSALACASPAPKGAEPARVSLEGTVGMNASPTADPALFTLFRPMRSEGLRVGIARRSEPGEIEWLKEGSDYSYDVAAAKIALRRGRAVDDDREFLFVTGTPEPRNVFLFRDAVDAGIVRAYVNDRELRAGEGFALDASGTRLTILDPAFDDPGARYHVRAGAVAIGNAPAPR